MKQSERVNCVKASGLTRLRVWRGQTAEFPEAGGGDGAANASDTACHPKVTIFNKIWNSPILLQSQVHLSCEDAPTRRKSDVSVRSTYD